MTKRVHKSHHWPQDRIKRKAQTMLLQVLYQVTFYSVAAMNIDAPDQIVAESIRRDILTELDRQIKRVHKLFGYRSVTLIGDPESIFRDGWEAGKQWEEKRAKDMTELRKPVAQGRGRVVQPKP